MKKNIIIILLLIITIGLGIWLFLTNQELKIQKEDYKEEIKELEEKIDKYKSDNSSEKKENSSNENYNSEDDSLDKITYNKFIKMIEDEKTFLILFTQTGCSHCTSFKPTISEIIEENNLTIYELNIGLLTEDEWYGLQEIVTVSGTPTLTSVKNGIESDSLVGNRDTEAVLKFLTEEGFIN